MQLRHLKTIMPPAEGICKVTAICWSANNKRLAVVTVDRVVHLFDEHGERKDKFSTKPADKGPKNYIVRQMQFSPDSTKLAVAQSDQIVFIYKLGLEWGEKKSICNKFHQSSPVTSLTWPSAHPNEVVFGLAEGKVKIGQLRTNKPATLYSTESYVISVTCSPDGHAILSSHLDGSVYRFYFEDGSAGPSYSKFCQHSSIPYCLGWGHSIICAGNDGRVVFYDPQDASVQRNFDYTDDAKVKEFSCAAFSPSGQSCVVGNFNKFFVYGYNNRTNSWEESSVKEIENLFTVTTAAWKFDGSRLAIGSLCGVVDLYDACIRRYRYRGKFEYTYVSLSQVIVKRLSNGTRIVLKSQFGCEITKINIFQDRFLIANTPETLLMGDLESCKLSEVPWRGGEGSKDKFFFDNETVCMAYNTGELTLVEYGKNEILGSCRTEHMSPHLISVRINERPPKRKPTEEELMMDPSLGDNKKLAYLLDIQTIRILDLVSGVTCGTINHDSKIDFLELNQRGTMMLFRDKRRHLHLYTIANQTRTTLLNYCNYAQWVPESDVVVAQNRNNLCVWYNVHSPDKVTIHELKGDVEEIERGDGKTQVIVDEGVNTVSYELDEGLIAFGTAMDDNDLDAAMDILDALPPSEEADAMWKQLSDLALMENKLSIAERCAAALGDVARARFLHGVNKIVQKNDGSQDFYAVKARMAMLRRDFKAAELHFLDFGQIDDAIEMYQVMHRWDQAILVAENNNHPEAKEMRRNYFTYLQESNQEEKAAELKAQEGDHMLAISLYLKGGLPAKAAAVVKNHPGSYGQDMLEKIASALSQSGMHEKAGDFFERMDQLQRALDAFVKGHAYRRAVSLARTSFPGKVVQLEEAWADWLTQQNQVDAAINHYIEAGVLTKAIDAALNSRQWSKAVQLVEDTLTDGDVARPYYRRIARHYQEAKSYQEAERFFVKAGEPEQAVEMYTRANRWDEAHAVAVTYMSESEVGMLYISQAQRMEAAGKLKQAEKLYLKVKEPDLAINMYKKARKYDDMIRLVTTYRKDLLKETHLHLAQQLEMEGVLKEAEHHYTQAQEWQSAVNMYRANDMWDEAIRVAKYNGGINASKQVAYAWAMSLGGEAGAKLLTKLGLIEQAIDYAIERRAFDHAFELARSCLKKKVPEVHLKHALFLEDEERFKEAEEEFISAGKPKEAIDMYLHQQDWNNAMRVAEQFDPSNIGDVLVAQGSAALERKDYQRAEGLFVNAKKPEKALRMYQDARMWNDAVRVAKIHLPHKLHAVNMARQRAAENDGGSKDDYLASARMWEDTGDYARAIDAYLNITSEHVQSKQTLGEIWVKAVQLASMHQKDRYSGVVTEVAHRLMEIERYDQAADMFKDIDRNKEAIDCYIRAGDWEKARLLTRTQAGDLKEYVEKAYHSHLVDNQDSEKCIESGNVTAGLDIMATRGEWKKLWEVAQKESAAVQGKYGVQYATKLMEEEKPSEAVAVLAQWGVSVNAKHVDFYKEVTSKALSLTQEQEESGNPTKVLEDLREFLFKLVSRHDRAGETANLAAYKRLLLVAHLTVLCDKSVASNKKDMAAKFAIALLRDCGKVPWDKAFMKAGDLCLAQGWKGQAYMFYNRFLDISEAMEDQDSSGIDNSDFADLSIPSPYNCKLPKKEEQYATEDNEEEVREKVLSWALDDSIDSEQALEDLKANLEWAELIDKRFNRSLQEWLSEGEHQWDDAMEIKQASRVG